MDRSFLPLKRKVLDHSNDFLEHPPSKRFLSEELVASHLEHLKLSSDGRWDGDSHWDTDGRCRDGGHSSPAPGKREASARGAPRQLNIKTVASCPHSHSIDCQISRKRFLRDCGQSERSSKRMRLDSETRMFLPNTKNGNRTNPGMELDMHQHNRAAVLTSVHGVGNVSDLSSIPEEIEPSQQPRPSGRYGSPSPEKELSQQHSTPSGIPYSVNSDVHEALTHLSLNLRPALSSAFLSPSPTTTPPHPPLVTDTNIECSVWVAPEIQAMSRRAESLLPISIVEEIRSVGMEVVPWVGLDAVLQGLTRKEEEGAESEEGGSHSQTTPIANHTSCDFKDFGMELN